ncbi:MAG: hypothetical protein IJ127_16355 [Afipia sp.]|nr:hypothetical protein [Afipia sp.]MBS4005935.1 hypothetical protein [Afipia sp.]MBS4006205.1 hypothetical protein [Afipia sp.]
MSARVRLKEVPDLYYFLRAAFRNNCFPSKVAPQVYVEITDVVPHAACNDEYCLVHFWSAMTLKQNAGDPAVKSGVEDDASAR